MPGTADILRPSRARAWLFAGLVLSASGARAGSDRLVLATHDAALASALSVAVSPRGLSVVELPEPLVGVGAADASVARREVAVPGTVAVVWLCDDGSSEPALCFCGADGRIVVKGLRVTAPLAPPDAAAVALSVKMMLGAPPPTPAPRPAQPPVPPAPLPPPAATAAPPRAPAWLAVEVDAGARLQSPASEHVGLRVGVKGVLAPAAFGRALGAGIGLATGPALAASASPGRTVSDSSVEAFARGHLFLSPTWLELDVGPSLHFLSADAGPAAPHRADLALDALTGVVLPVGPAQLGVRAGGFYVLTSPTTVAGATTPVALPRWNGEAMLTLGFTVR